MNFNLEEIITPMNPDLLEYYLHISDYDEDETQFLVDGFCNGFDIGYEGPINRRDESRNIPFQVGVGDEFEMWEKIQEIKLKRYAGPFEEVPFRNYIQSPVGLVPKSGNKTRLIFHLSYCFRNGNKSVNHHIPAEKCMVKYNDLDMAVRLSLIKIKNGAQKLYYSKTDLMSTFRILPLKFKSLHWLVMKCRTPWNKKMYYIIEKNLPFSSSISCHHF